MSSVIEQFPKRTVTSCRVVLASPVMVEGKATNRGQAHEEAGPRYSPFIAQFPSALFLHNGLVWLWAVAPVIKCLSSPTVQKSFL